MSFTNRSGSFRYATTSTMVANHAIHEIAAIAIGIAIGIAPLPVVAGSHGISRNRSRPRR